MLYLLATLQSFVATTKDRANRDERGATAVEYGLLVGGIALAIIVGVGAFGGELNTFFNGLGAKLKINS